MQRSPPPAQPPDRPIRRGYKAIFYGDQRLRPGARVAAYLAAFLFLCALVAGSTLLLRALGSPRPLTLGWASVALVYGTIRVTRFFRRSVDRADMCGIALSDRRRIVHAATGAAMGGGVLVGAVAVQVMLGWVEPGSVVAPRAMIAVSVLAAALWWSAVGFSEEVAFRGYILQNLGESLPLWGATIIAGLIFAVTHLGNALSIIDFLDLLVFTLVTVAMRVVTGSLWMSIGYHAAWNFVDSLATVRPPNDPTTAIGEGTVITLIQDGPPLWVGDGSGIGGGLLGLAGDLLVFVALCGVAAYRGGLPWRASLSCGVRARGE